MKKIAAIILMLVYGMSSSGMSVTADYCCGKLSKIGVSLKQNENSKQDNQLQNKKCCGHKEVSFKVKTDHEITAKQNIDFSTQTIVQPVFFDVASSLNFLNKTIFQNSNGPPLFNAVPGYIFNCVFRI
jgi:hypothetical protein